MIYNSKKNLISIAAGIISVAAYIVYVGTGNAPSLEEVQAWAKLMLIFIGVSVAVQIIVQIVSHIVFAITIAVRENDNDGEKTKKIMDAAMIEDERDKLINLKSSHIGYICAGVGLLAALFFLAGGGAVVISLHIILGSCVAGTLIEGGVGIFLHERGVWNGR